MQGFANTGEEAKSIGAKSKKEKEHMASIAALKTQETKNSHKKREVLQFCTWSYLTTFLKPEIPDFDISVVTAANNFVIC